MNGSDPTQTADTSRTQSSGATIEETPPQSPVEVVSTSSQSGAAVGAQAPAPTSDVSPPVPLDDQTVSAVQTTEAIHNAFLIGWSLQELKSNVLLAALGLQQSSYTSNPTPKMGPTNGSSVTDTPHSLSGMVDMLMQRALASVSSVTSQMLGLQGDSIESLARTSE